ncbi:MAG TPA: twin-arginine translocase TatA/TatE family subunit [Pyrinomonadaceae bacterium]|nr:twin-arginine translocase TatA/TatE family subunit [Pyrinomonadaceae bacterium]
MFALILESLGSTELLFILAIALIFFGPRKLPQLARSMGKGLAEFRRASDDFKRTWEREVALESARVEDNTILDNEPDPYGYTKTDDTPAIENPEPAPELVTADPELAVPRESVVETTSEGLAEVPEIPTEPAQPEPVRKQDWL